jgi:hypothetical protein
MIQAMISLFLLASMVVGAFVLIDFFTKKEKVPPKDVSISSKLAKEITKKQKIENKEKKRDFKKMTNEQLFELLTKRLDNIDRKIDLIIDTPTIQKEIDHDSLNKLK